MPKLLWEAKPDVTCPRCGIRVEGLDFSSGILIRVPGQGAWVGNSEDDAPRPIGDWEPFPPEDRHRLQPCGHQISATEAAAIHQTVNAFYQEKAARRQAELRTEIIGLGVSPEIADQVIETVRTKSGS